MDINIEILEAIKELYVDCPDCKWVYGDDQYTCTTCWREGGSGKINVFEWLKEHKYLLE